MKSALEMGVVPGGGACMLHMAGDEQLKQAIIAEVGDDEDTQLGVEIMFRSLPAPMKQIAKNAGLEGNEQVASLMACLYVTDDCCCCCAANACLLFLLCCSCRTGCYS